MKNFEGGENSNINIIINNNYNKYNICTIINGAVVDAVRYTSCDTLF